MLEVCSRNSKLSEEIFGGGMRSKDESLEGMEQKEHHEGNIILRMAWRCIRAWHLIRVQDGLV